MSVSEFNVRTRSGKLEPIRFDEISRRNEQLVNDLGIVVNVAKLTQTVIQGLTNNITTEEIDRLSSETAISLSIYEPEYDQLAARIFMDNLHKTTPSTFLECFTDLHESGLIHTDVYAFYKRHADAIEAAIDSSRDFKYHYFGCKTLEKGYLLKYKGKIWERPQYMIMRVALGIHYRNEGSRPLTTSEASEANGSEANGKEANVNEASEANGKEAEVKEVSVAEVSEASEVKNSEATDPDHALRLVLETYDQMSQLYMTHASPTLFNGGTSFPQLSSCFLLGVADSLDHIYQTLYHSAMISKHGGGIGINVSNVRSKGSTIQSTHGTSDGIIPMIRVFNETARYVNQSGKRKGSIAMYLEPWHPEIMEFLELRLNNGTEEVRARDIFTALWIPDLFMKRVEASGSWTLFDPNLILKTFGKGLQDVHGAEFEAIYTEAERRQLGKTVPARDIWTKVLESQIETGTPYLMYKDPINAKNSQTNIGVIRGSNLCAEILEYTDPNHISVCNLASIAINMFVKRGEPKENEAKASGSEKEAKASNYFDYEHLGRVVRILVRNLNQIIDHNYYPVEPARVTNQSHRPIGIGLQGLHDLFCLMKLEWDSPEAKRINRMIVEVMYYHAMDESANLAATFGSYSRFEGSPMSQGILHPDMYKTGSDADFFLTHDTLDWPALRRKVALGMRNSLLLSLMPTASTSQLLGNTEAFEPVTSNLYTRKVLAGDFPIVNQHLYRELNAKGLWNKTMVNDLIRNNGSVQDLDLPEDVKRRFRTVWELSMKTVIDLAADRMPFIDQTQSMNLFVAKPTLSNLTSMHFYGWKKGLKTGCYYLRSKPKTEAVKFSLLEDSALKRFKGKDDDKGSKAEVSEAKKVFVCTDDICTSCSA